MDQQEPMHYEPVPENVPEVFTDAPLSSYAPPPPPPSPIPPARNNYLIPISIVIAGIIIGGSLIYVKRHEASSNIPQTQIADITVNPVTQGDHILGSPNAPIKLVEFSDLDCPYCQHFQPIVHKLVDTYGKNAKFAWVYRHFSFHDNKDLGLFASIQAQGSECVAELGGNDKFWLYIDTIFAKQHFPTSQTDKYIGVDPKELPAIAESLGVDRTSFNQCLASNKYDQKIKTQYDEGIQAGLLGTPHSVILLDKKFGRQVQDYIDSTNTKILLKAGAGTTAPFSVSQDKTKIIISGAMDYAFLDQLMKLLISTS